MNEYSLYKNLQGSILKKYNSFKEKDILSFLEEESYFKLASAISYLILSKESMFDQEYTNVNESTLDSMFTKDFCESIPIFYEKGDSRSNMINLRCSFSHSQFEIDFDKHILKIRNEKTGFNCDLPFEWLINFLDYQILSEREMKLIDIKGIFIDEKSIKHNNCFKTEEEVNNFIDNLIVYKISLENNRHKLNEQEVKNFIKKFFSDENQRNILNDVINLNYKGKWNYLKDELKKEIKEKFPNTKVSISIVRDEKITEKLKRVYSLNSRKFLEMRNHENQCLDIINKTEKFYNRTKDDVAKVIGYINDCINDYKNIINSEEYKECIPIKIEGIDEELNYKELIDYIMNSKEDKTSLELIHEFRKNKGCSNSYDKMPINSESGFLSKKEVRLVRKYFNRKFELDLGECYEIELENLRLYHSRIYERCKRKFEREDSVGVEDCKYYNDKIINTICKIKDNFKAKQEKIELAMIYILGISTFVINKEKDFTDDDSIDIDFSKIKCYSASSYEREKNKIQKNERTVKREIELLKEQIETVEDRKKIKRIKEFLGLKECILDYYKEGQKTINNKKMYYCEKDEIFGLIRNGFSHSCKIRFKSFKEGTLEIIDDDSYAECKAKDLISFITNVAFKNIMKDKYDIKKDDENVDPEGNNVNPDDKKKVFINETDNKNN